MVMHIISLTTRMIGKVSWDEQHSHVHAELMMMMIMTT